MERTKDADLVSQIVGFTSLRDIDLLELSLLKSVYTTLRPLKVSLISLDTNNIILKQVDYSASHFGQVTLDTPADDRLISITENLDNAMNNYATFAFADVSLTLFLLFQNRRVSHYICIESAKDTLTQADSNQIIGMLKIFQNFRALLRESQTDELTGLANRKAFNDVISNIHQDIGPTNTSNSADETLDSDTPFYLALVDLDNFKAINDNFGHLMGDEVLIRVAQSIQASIRDTDLAFRYGGEEFAILAPAGSRTEMEKLLERVRLNIESLYISQIGVVTASFGAVQMRKDVFYLSSIEAADKALYQSKNEGKNRVTFADNEQKQESFEDDIELF